MPHNNLSGQTPKQPCSLAPWDIYTQLSVHSPSTAPKNIRKSNTYHDSHHIQWIFWHIASTEEILFPSRKFVIGELKLQVPVLFGYKIS